MTELSRQGVRLRFLSSRSLTPDRRKRLAEVAEATFLPMEAIGERGTLNVVDVRPVEDLRSGYTMFFDGDVVIAKITPCFENGKGAVIRGMENGVGFGTTELHVVAPHAGLDPRYLYYLTSSLHFRKWGEAQMTGSAGQKRVPVDFVLDYRVPVLDREQQCAIADFLDVETARIDALIAAKENLLVILAEKRSALVTQAVTRGLDPNVPMRDSGVPWLGDIPAPWEVTRLKLVATVQTGFALGKRYGNEELTAYPYLRVANVQDSYLDLAEIKTVEVSAQDALGCQLKAGDVLMNEGGDADKLGRGAVWTGEIDPCLHQNHVFAVRPHGVSPEWLSVWASSDGAKAFFVARAKQSTNLASISATNLKELPIPIPPEGEQLRIVEYLEEELDRFTQLEMATRVTIELLAERRAAVMAAAVRGQINVGAA